MFMGTVGLVARKLANNDKQFFIKFTKVRSRLERILIEHKDLIATILQRQLSRRRAETHGRMLQSLIEALMQDKSPSENDLVDMAEMSGKIIVGLDDQKASAISDDTKSKVFIDNALSSALKCPICEGFLDPAKSVSYDHIKNERAGGKGDATNVQMTHPYCNQSIKN
jgi:HNH endonuclease